MVTEITKSTSMKQEPDHDACGMGFVAALDGKPTHKILKYGLEAVSNMEHRGGVAADLVIDSETGEAFGTADGTGLTIQIDQDWWKKKFIRRFPEGTLFSGTIEKDAGGRGRILLKPSEQGKLDIAVGNFFLPRGNRDNTLACQNIINKVFKEYGYEISDREPPLGDGSLGLEARNSHPRVFQYAVLQKPGTTGAEFDRDLYITRRTIEKEIEEAGLSGQGQNRFYIPSLSRYFITFKSLALGHKFSELYKDLKDKEDKEDKEDEAYKTAFAIFHDRFSTNTMPTWERSHPNDGGVAHNGEINSLQTNIEIFKRIERVFLNDFPDLSDTEKEALLNVIREDGTDSAMLGNVVDFLIHAGFSPPAIKCMLVPEALMDGVELPNDVREMYKFLDVLMGPWDGPNAMVMYGHLHKKENDPGERIVTMSLDANAFRPARYVRTKDNIVYAASEDGIIHDIPNADIVERGILGPGGIIAANLDQHRLMYDKELKERAAKELQEKLDYKATLQNMHDMPHVPATPSDYRWSGHKLPDDEKLSPEDWKQEKEQRTRQLQLNQRTGAFSQETIDFIDHMAKHGKEPSGSMGDDAALEISSPIYRTFQNFFQQRFAQVTNPPLDTIREKIVTSLKNYLGFPYDKDGNKTDEPIYSFDHAILNRASFHAMLQAVGEPDVVEINCTFDIRGDENQLKFALDEIYHQAYSAAAAGKQIVLTDEHTDSNHAAVPMLLAIGKVHTALGEAGLRKQTSINIKTRQAFEGHDFAAMIACGADRINPYMAEETIAANHRLGAYKFEDDISAFQPETTLEYFKDLYIDTRDAELDQHRKELIERPDISAFFKAHANTSLEDMARHPDLAVRKNFDNVMKTLEVKVTDIYGTKSLDHAFSNWRKAAENSLLKIMGKMGIARLSSYAGGRLLEALGVSQDVIDECFPGVQSIIGGLNLSQIQQREAAHHRKVWAADPDMPLQNVGRYKFRTGAHAEPHLLTAELIEDFQDSVKEKTFEAGYAKYKIYRDKLLERTQRYRFGPRDWMDFKKVEPVDLSLVESRENIKKRFSTGAMSDGSIDFQVHENLAIAANRAGLKSNSGEGGEDPERLGTEKRSKIKQVASGRFGVTTDYLLDAEEIQIKVAQGAKPGEGGELAGSKVNARIAFLRHSTPGVGLISPPPHHDIYSIEDLEQLIYDLKQINPKAQVSVKLVASTGIETIAAGCVKAGPDTVCIGGGFYSGTGNSPQGSIAHAGMPWELYKGIHDKLVSLNLRERVKLRVDGGIRTGRDIVIAAILGFEEYSFGTEALIGQGCKLIRQCQNEGVCPYHIASQTGELIGTPEMEQNRMEHKAEDVREVLASLGLKSIDEAIGRTDLLKQVWGQDKGIDLSKVIAFDAGRPRQKCELKPGERNERIDPKRPYEPTLDQKILDKYLDKMKDAIRHGKKIRIKSKITNEDRTFGARISGILRQWCIDEFGRKFKIPDDTITFDLKGTAGQSLGFGLIHGLTIRLEGAANDGVGKSCSGGKINIFPDRRSPINDNPQNHVIAGNAVGYGGTNGEINFAGSSGNRFAVRGSGMRIVVEGAEYALCEYMTAGEVLALGQIGPNFGAGMSGGRAFIYDPDDALYSLANKDVSKKIRTLSKAEEKHVKGWLRTHFKATKSAHAKNLLQNWNTVSGFFKIIDMRPPANDNTRASLPVLEKTMGLEQ